MSARFLRYLLDSHAATIAGRALAAYYQGPGSVAAPGRLCRRARLRGQDPRLPGAHSPVPAPPRC